MLELHALQRATGREKIPRFAPSIRILQSAIRVLAGTSRAQCQVPGFVRKTASQLTQRPPLLLRLRQVIGT